MGAQACLSGPNRSHPAPAPGLAFPGSPTPPQPPVSTPDAPGVRTVGTLALARWGWQLCVPEGHLSRQPGQHGAGDPPWGAGPGPRLVVASCRKQEGGCWATDCPGADLPIPAAPRFLPCGRAAPGEADSYRAGSTRDSSPQLLPASGPPVRATLPSDCGLCCPSCIFQGPQLGSPDPTSTTGPPAHLGSAGSCPESRPCSSLPDCSSLGSRTWTSERTASRLEGLQSGAPLCRPWGPLGSCREGRLGYPHSAVPGTRSTPAGTG